MASFMRFSMGRRNALTVAMVVVLSNMFASYVRAEEVSSRAMWMQGRWGLRVVLPAGNTPEANSFDIEGLVRQLSQYRTASWVMVNLTQGAIGSFFTGTSDTLSKIDPAMVPRRDLLGEAIYALKREKYRVFVYFAAQGPMAEVDVARQKNNKAQLERLPAIKRIRLEWLRFAENRNLTPEEATAKYCIEEYSLRYGDGIDGWWFDHGRWGNPSLYIAAARSGNPKSVVTWNDKNRRTSIPAGVDRNGKVVKGWTISRATSFDDYTNGHVTPTHIQPPWWSGNETVVRDIENGPWVDGALGHMFLPVQRDWRGGSPNFPTTTLLSWVTRILEAGGAVTLAVALRSPEYRYAEIAGTQAEQLTLLDRAVQKRHPNLIRH